MGVAVADGVDQSANQLEITGHDLYGVKLEASLVFPGGIKSVATKWRVGPSALIDDKEALKVQGTTAAGATVTF